MSDIAELANLFLQRKQLENQEINTKVNAMVNMEQIRSANERQQKSLDHDKNMYEIKIKDQKESLYNQARNEYGPGVTQTKEGYPDLTKINPYEGLTYRTAEAPKVTEFLSTFGIASTGDVDQDKNMYNVLMQGRLRGQSFTGTTISPIYAALAGGDPTKGALTSGDLESFQNTVMNNIDSPYILTDLVNEGYISNPSVLGLEMGEGFWQIPRDSDGNAEKSVVDNIKYYHMAFTQGLQTAEKVVTDQAYHDQEMNRTLSRAQIASTIAGSGSIVNLSNKIEDDKAAIGALVGSVFSEGMAVMNWKVGGELGTYSLTDITDQIRDVLTKQGVPENEISGFTTFVDKLMGVGQNGIGVDNIIDLLNVKDADGNYIYRDKYFNYMMETGGDPLVKTLQRLSLLIENKDKLANELGAWMPKAGGQLDEQSITEINALVTRYNIPNMLIQLRALEAKGMQNSSEYNIIKSELEKSSTDIVSKYSGTPLYDKYLSYLEMEDLTNKIRLQTGG